MINDKITKIFEHCVPNNFASVLEECNKIERKNYKMKNKTTIFRKFAYLSFGIIVGIAGLFTYQKMELSKIASTVLLDVNPSIELNVNKNDKIISVNPLNEDAKIIIDNMNLKNSDLNIAINALIGSMLKKGYLTELQNSVLISISSKNNTKSTELQTILTNEINGILKSSNIDGSILTQLINVDDSEKSMAKKYNISIGKVKLINKIIHNDSTLLFEDLANMLINELNLINNSKKIQSDDIMITGEASIKSYITENEAKKIAINNANVKETDIYDYNIDFDSENGILCYEIEFKTKTYEYDYDINALNGNIIKKEKEKNDENVISDTSNKKESYITKAKAKALALNKVGIKSDQIKEYEIELDKKDSAKEVDKYEISFKYNNYEFDIEINAITGGIINVEKEIDD